MVSLTAIAPFVFDRRRACRACSAPGVTAMNGRVGSGRFTLRTRGSRRITMGVAAMMLVLASSPSALAEDVAWVRQWGTAADDIPSGIALDDAGNAYVVTYSNAALGTLRRFDGDGNTVWEGPFDAEGRAQPGGIAVGAHGVVAVGGSAFGILPGQTSAGLPDAVVRRYDTDGNEVWTRQFGGAGADFAGPVTVTADGDIAVAGSTLELPGQLSLIGGDAFVRVYDVDGNEQWTHEFGSSGADYASAVASASGGRIIVAGWTDGALPGQVSSGLDDAFVRVYDAAGTELWTRQFGTSDRDVADAVTVGSTGDVIVAGSTRGTLPGQDPGRPAGNADAFVRKYSADGNELWTRQFEGGVSQEEAYGVATDAVGNVAVTGITYGHGFVREYDMSGNEEWTLSVGSTQSAGEAVAMDGHSVFVAGATSDSYGGPSAGRNDGWAMKLVPPHSCHDTTNSEADETGPVSAPVHATLEPLVGPAQPGVHQLNCTVIVPAGF